MCGQVKVENEEGEEETEENLTDNVSQINQHTVLACLECDAYNRNERKGGKLKKISPSSQCAGKIPKENKLETDNKTRVVRVVAKFWAQKKERKNKRKTTKEKQSGKQWVSECGFAVEEFFPLLLLVESRENHGSDRVLRNERECVA